MHVVQGKHFLKIASNSVAFASEVLENIEEMFSWYNKCELRTND